jgi:hypothetical protein
MLLPWLFLCRGGDHQLQRLRSWNARGLNAQLGDAGSSN